MSVRDRVRWDDRYREPQRPDDGPPAVLVGHADLVPTAGRALDLACGRGRASVWLAERGLDVWGVDVSPVAIDQASELAHRRDVADRCRFEVVDLDDGLPDGPPVDLVVCHRFRDRRLDEAIVDRLAPGGLLVIVALSQVGAGPGPFRAAPGGLTTAFATLDPLVDHEAAGTATLVARAPGRG